MTNRNFALTEEADEDFTVIVVWRKAVNARYDKFESISDANDFNMHRDSILHRISTQYDLSLEMFQPSTGYRFWERRVPRAFEALEISDYLIRETIISALKNFPTKADKDPNLPDLE